MTDPLQEEVNRRAEEYVGRHDLRLEPPHFGHGVHGNVYRATRQSGGGDRALKVHRREEFFKRERDVYYRLQSKGVLRIRDSNVPQLLNADNELWAIEMTIVTRPFVLDFAGAYLDAPPDYPADVLAEWRRDKKEQFEEYWPEVQAILGNLRRFGIHMLDVSPGNIAFPGNEQ